MMKCHNCLKEIKDDANFCPHCGTAVVKSSPAVPKDGEAEVKPRRIAIPVMEKRTPIEPEVVASEVAPMAEEPPMVTPEPQPEMPEPPIAAEEPQTATPEPQPGMPEPPIAAEEPPMVAPEPRPEMPEPPIAAEEPPMATPEPQPGMPEPPIAAEEPPMVAPEPQPGMPEPPIAAEEPPMVAPEPQPVIPEPLSNAPKSGDTVVLTDNPYAGEKPPTVPPSAYAPPVNPPSDGSDYVPYMPPVTPANIKKLKKEAEKRAKIEAENAKKRAKIEAKNAKKSAKKKKHTGLKVLLVFLVLLLLVLAAGVVWLLSDRGVIDLESVIPGFPELPPFPEIGFLEFLDGDADRSDDEDEDTEEEDEDDEDVDDETSDSEEDDEDTEESESSDTAAESDTEEDPAEIKAHYAEHVDDALVLLDARAPILSQASADAIMEKAIEVSEEENLSIILIIEEKIFEGSEKDQEYMLNNQQAVFDHYSYVIDEYCIFYIDTKMKTYASSMSNEFASAVDESVYKEALQSFKEYALEDGYEKAIIKLLDSIPF